MLQPQSLQHIHIEGTACTQIHNAAAHEQQKILGCIYLCFVFRRMVRGGYKCMCPPLKNLLNKSKASTGLLKKSFFLILKLLFFFKYEFYCKTVTRCQNCFKTDLQTLEEFELIFLHGVETMINIYRCVALHVKI